MYIVIGTDIEVPQIYGSLKRAKAYAAEVVGNEADSEAYEMPTRDIAQYDSACVAMYHYGVNDSVTIFLQRKAH